MEGQSDQERIDRLTHWLILVRDFRIEYRGLADEDVDLFLVQLELLRIATGICFDDLIPAIEYLFIGPIRQVFLRFRDTVRTWPEAIERIRNMYGDLDTENLDPNIGAGRTRP